MTMTTTTRFDRRRTGGGLVVCRGWWGLVMGLNQVGGLDFFRVALLEDQDEREDRLGRSPPACLPDDDSLLIVAYLPVVPPSGGCWVLID